MKDIVIFGNSNFSRLLKWYIDNDDERKVVAFCVEKEFLVAEEIDGIPVVDFDEVDKNYPTTDYDILLGIGYRNMNKIREKIFKKCKEKGYTIASYYHSSSIIQTKEIGEGNIILEQSLLCPFVSIGDGNLIWNNVSIAHDDKIGNFNTMSGLAGIAGNVTVGNNCFFGKSSVVRDHVTIADYSLIGAGAYVNRDISEKSVVVAPKSVILESKVSFDYL